MSATFARPLNDNELAHLFLVKVLGLPNNEATGTVAFRIRAAETLLREMEGKSTLTSVENRHPHFVDNNTRKALREQIFSDLIERKRIVDDEKIGLSKGGARPRTGVKKEKKAFIVTGLPASGKSSISAAISDVHGAYIVDPDYAKRKFPEYSFDFGASLVHEESSLVVNGDNDSPFADEPNLLEACVENRTNIVIPKIGYNVHSLRELRDDLLASGYEVHLTLVSLDRVCATKRALDRYINTNRYVPLSLVFDGYSNDPALTYYRSKEDTEWASIGKISTNVARGSRPVVIEGGANNPARIYA